MYRLALAEGQRALDDQQDELNGLRSRAVSFVAFVGSATAFLVGSSLVVTSPERDLVFFLLAIAASIVAGLMLVKLFAVLRPSSKYEWQYRLSSQKLIQGWIESDVPAPNMTQFLRSLANTYDDMRVENEKLLANIRGHYVHLVIGGIAQLILWAFIVWAKR